MTGARVAFEAELPFPLDAFQRRALDALDAGRSVLVAAPTGSGKTVVAEYAVADALASGLKAFYTAPIKALSNQKYRDLADRHGPDQVGLLTGDNSINGEAPVVVMTTEVLRNMIYERSPTLSRLGVVILDEVHYLQDPYRGAVWEEVIIHLDPIVRLVCLSATVSNAEEFGDWLATVRGDTAVVIEEERPVTLEHLYGVALKDEDRLRLFDTFVTSGGRLRPNQKPGRYDPVRTARGSGPRHDRRRRSGPRPVAPRRVDVVDELEGRGMLPAIYFIFSRAGCDAAVEQCLAARLRLTDESERAALRAIAERHCAGLPDPDLDALGYPTWLSALESGVAAHHAGMVPPMKEAVEEAFQAGLVQVVFATETLALGINMPARSVVIERLTKFTGESHEMLTPGQYTQLTGRAGRRGIDDIGYGIVLWNRFATFDQVASLASRRTYELTSSFRPTYNMAVNLIRRYERDDAHRLLNLSFAQYRADREVVAVQRRTEDTQARLGDARAAMQCELGDVDEYRELLDAREQARRAPGVAEGQARHVARLRPGDIIEAGHGLGRVVVLQRSSGRGATPRVTAVDAGGRAVRLTAGSFGGPPKAVGRIELPEPFRPKQASFRREAARRLRSATIDEEPRVDRTRSSVESLDATIDAHPVAGCPDLRRHLEAARRVDRLERQLGRARAPKRGRTLSAVFDDVLALLEARGYVDGWSLTEPGEVLARVYNEADLLVAEALGHGLLDDITPPEAAAIVSVFTYETRGPEPQTRPRWPTAEVARRAHAIEDLWSDLRSQEREAGLPETRMPDGGFADAAFRWADGQGLAGLLDDEDDLTGGDFVRNVKQVIDMLRQLGDAAPDPRTAATCRSAADALSRGVIEVSSRIGD